MRNLISYSIFSGLLFLILPVVVSAQQVASLSMIPERGVYPIGDPFTVEVRIHSGGNSIGTANATISFNPEDVSYVAVSDEGSIFSTLLVDSTRKEGEVDISGFVERGQSPYIGSNGLFATVTFVPLRNVASEFHFASGAATAPLPLAASVGDLGNVLSNLNAATYTFVPKERVPSAVVYASEQTDFEITPIPVPKNEWFATTSVKLSWTLPGGVTEMRTLVTGNPEEEPTQVYQVPVSSVPLTDLAEGLNYFLLQFKINDNWDSVIKYPLRVDLSSPEYVIIKETERADISDPRVSFIIESADSYSGVQRYEVGIDGDTPVEWIPNESDTYSPEGLNPGEHVLTAVAYDKAGNSTSTDYVFHVNSLTPPTLNNEKIPDYKFAGDTVTVEGTTYPNSDVTIYVSHDDGEAKEKIVKSDESGRFVADIAETAKAGKYTIWLSVRDDRGAMSPSSVKRSIDVIQPRIMVFSGYAVTYLSVIVPMVALIMILFLILWLGYTWMRGYKRRVKRETNDAYGTTKKEFDALREELMKQIGMLEKANQSRELTKEEMRIFTDLSKRLDKMEQQIMYEIENIESVDETQFDKPEEVQTTQGALEKYKAKLKKGEQIYEETHTVRL